jgi:hypothetical protein
LLSFRIEKKNLEEAQVKWGEERDEAAGRDP